jgi:uncharacterized membrane protein YagU involved in acid resistance
MVAFEWWVGLVAGFAGTLVMSAAMAMAHRANMTGMPPIPLIMGTMMTGDRRRASMMGTFAHYLVMGSVMFGLTYAWLFSAFDSSSWLTGLVIGAVHGLVVGAAAMPVMPAMHPRMEPVATGPTGEAVTEIGGEVRLSAAGFMGIRWGGMTPVGLLMGHIIYGVVVALVYGALVDVAG